MEKRTGRFAAIFLAAGILAACFAIPSARAIDKVDSPNVTEGELDLEYSGSRSFDHNSDKNDLQNTEALLAYAPTDRWEVDVGGFFSRDPDHSFGPEGVLLENFFQFFEKGSHWVDSGIMVAYNGATRATVPDSIETKLLLEKDIGNFVNILNVGLEQEVGAYARGGPAQALEWSSQYAIDDDFAPGFEIQSDFGKTSEGIGLNRGQHYIGPAVYGNLLDCFHYEVVYLVGVSRAASDSAVRFLFQYQMHL